MSLGALEVGIGRYGRRRGACSGNVWPAGRWRAARVGLAAYGAAEEGRTTRSKSNTEMITQDLENQ